MLSWVQFITRSIIPSKWQRISLWSCYARQILLYGPATPCRQILDIPLCIISLWSCPVSWSWKGNSWVMTFPATPGRSWISLYVLFLYGPALSAAERGTAWWRQADTRYPSMYYFSLVLSCQLDWKGGNCRWRPPLLRQPDTGYPSMYYYSMVLPCQLELEGGTAGWRPILLRQADIGYPSMYYFSMVLPCQLELEGEQLGDDLSCYWISLYVLFLYGPALSAGAARGTAGWRPLLLRQANPGGPSVSPLSPHCS